MLIAGLIFILLLGFTIGYIVRNVVVKASISGTLKIDISDPDGPYLFVVLEEDVNTIKRKDCVIFKVDISNYLSQK